MISVEKIFDKTAGSYDKSEEGRFEKYSIITLENTKKYLKADDVVLDFGCATGTKAIQLSRHVKKIHAIDISLKMIELAKKKAFEKNINNVDFVKTNIFDPELKQESFDVVTVFNILHLLENSEQAIQRITELLKPGGLFISTSPCLGEKMKFSQKFIFSFVLLLKKIGLFPDIKRFKFNELKDLITTKELEIIEAEKYFFDLSSYFIVATKKTL